MDKRRNHLRGESYGIQDITTARVKTTREVKKPSRSKSTGNRDREHRSKGESSSRAAVIAADATRTQQTSRATRQMSTSMTGGDILPRRSTRKKAIRAEDVDMSYRDPDADDDDDPDEEYVASDDTYVDGPQKLTRSQSQRIRRPRTAVNPGLMRSKSAKETSSSSTNRKRTTTQRKQKVTSGIRTANDTTITRAEAQYADPRSQRTEFSLGNLEQLAAEGLQRRPTLPRSSAFPSSSSTPPQKPSFSYREEGPLPKTDAEHHASLTGHISAKNLTSILPPSSPLVRQVATSAASMAAGVARSLYLSPYATPDLTKLGLYDVIVFCDDSTSMQKEERWATLKTVVRRIARISSAYNPQGIKIRFINSSNDAGFNGVVTEDQVETCLDAVTMARGTMIGTKLFEKVVLREIVEKAKRGELTKPVVVSVVTDGEPSGEHTDTLKRTILATKNELSKLPTPSGGKYGSSAVVFQIARVGTSAAAKRYVSSLQHDKDLKGLVYCTEESLDWAMGEAENNGQMNTWLTQVLAGSIKA
ncbi:hypothetical protein BDD12DRAFT_333422 [Trichophaea hybrida]|nr:hypothetical protein BDD12DRAFT_333422 [Trichophaea hybrida]